MSNLIPLRNEVKTKNHQYKFSSDLSGSLQRIVPLRNTSRALSSGLFLSSLLTTSPKLSVDTLETLLCISLRPSWLKAVRRGLSALGKIRFPTPDWQRQSSGQIKKHAFPAPVTRVTGSGRQIHLCGRLRLIG
jgi:hypothetical protein